MLQSEFQDLSTVQSNLQATPATLASAATIAPITFLTFITGTVQVANITPPINGTHLLALVFTDANPGAFLNSGNIVSTKDPAQNELVLVCYDPLSGDYYVVN
jgi:hypothetical protein